MTSASAASDEIDGGGGVNDLHDTMIGIRITEYYYDSGTSKVPIPDDFNDHRFVLEVKCESLTFYVDRNYIDFVALDRKIRKTYPESKIDPLPLDAYEMLRRMLSDGDNDAKLRRRSFMGFGAVKSPESNIRASMATGSDNGDVGASALGLTKALRSGSGFESEVIPSKIASLNLYLRALMSHHELVASDELLLFVDEEAASFFVDPRSLVPLTVHDILFFTHPPVKKTVQKKEIRTFNVQPGQLVVWRFTTRAFDIGFSVEMGGEMKVAYTRYKSNIKPVCGTLEASHAGECKLTFDNSYAKLHAKKLEYNVLIVTQDDYEEARHQAMEVQREKKKFETQRHALKRCVCTHGALLSGVHHSSSVEHDHDAEQNQIIKDKEVEVASLKKLIRTYQTDFEDGQVRVLEVEALNEELEESCRVMEESKNKISDSWRFAVSQLDTARGEAKEAQEQLAALEICNEEVKGAFDIAVFEHQHEKEELQGSVTALQGEVTKARGQLVEHLALTASLQESLKEAEADKDSLLQRIEEVEEEHQTQQRENQRREQASTFAHEAEVKALYDELVSTRDLYSSTVGGSNAEAEALMIKYRANVEELNEAHRVQLAEMATTMSNTNDTYNDIIEGLKHEYGVQMEEEEEAHQRDIEEVRSEAEAKVHALETLLHSLKESESVAGARRASFSTGSVGASPTPPPPGASATAGSSGALERVQLAQLTVQHDEVCAELVRLRLENTENARRAGEVALHSQSHSGRQWEMEQQVRQLQEELTVRRQNETFLQERVGQLQHENSSVRSALLSISHPFMQLVEYASRPGSTIHSPQTQVPYYMPQVSPPGGQYHPISQHHGYQSYSGGAPPVSASISSTTPGPNPNPNPSSGGLGMIFPAVGSGFGTTSAYSSSGGSVHAPYPRHTQYDQTPVALPPTSASSSLQGHSQQVSPLPSPARRTPSGQGLGVASQPMYSPAAHVYSASDPRPQGDMFEGSDPTGGNTLRESLPKDQNQYVDQEQTELESGGPAQISNSTAPPVIPVDSAADGSRKQQPAVPVSSNPGSPTEVSTGASTTAEQSPAPSIIHAPGPAEVMNHPKVTNKTPFDSKSAVKKAPTSSSSLSLFKLGSGTRAVASKPAENSAAASVPASASVPVSQPNQTKSPLAVSTAASNNNSNSSSSANSPAVSSNTAVTSPGATAPVKPSPRVGSGKQLAPTAGVSIPEAVSNRRSSRVAQCEYSALPKLLCLVLHHPLFTRHVTL